MFCICLTRFVFLDKAELFIDSDESLIGVMGKHILDGKPVPIFSYGQAYKGTFESITHTLFFKVFGISSFILKLVPFFYLLLSILLICVILNKFTKLNYNNYLTLLIFVPLFSLVICLKAGYGMEVVFFCFLFLLLFFEFKREKNINYLYLMAFIVGFTLYLQAMSLPFFLVVMYVGILDQKPGNKILRISFKHVIIVISSLVIGFSPAIYFKIIFGFNYDVNLKLDLVNNLLHNFNLVINKIIPAFFGGYDFEWGSYSIFSLSEIVLVFVGVFAFLYAIFIKKKELFDLIFFKKRDFSAEIYFLTIFIAYIVILFVSPYVRDIYSLRYLLTIVLIYPILIIIAERNLRCISVLLSQVFIIFFVCGSFMLMMQIFFINKNTNTKLFRVFFNSFEYNEVIEFLIENDYKYGFADYWDQWNINFLSEEKISLAAFEPGDYWRNRYIPYYHSAINSPDPVYIYRHPIKKENFNVILSSLPSDYEYIMINNFVVFYKARDFKKS